MDNEKKCDMCEDGKQINNLKFCSHPNTMKEKPFQTVNARIEDGSDCPAYQERARQILSTIIAEEGKE